MKLTDALIRELTETATDAVHCNVRGNIHAAMEANRKLKLLRAAAVATGCARSELDKVEHTAKQSAVRGDK